MPQLNHLLDHRPNVLCSAGHYIVAVRTILLKWFEGSGGKRAFANEIGTKRFEAMIRPNTISDNEISRYS